MEENVLKIEFRSKKIKIQNKMYIKTQNKMQIKMQVKMQIKMQIKIQNKINKQINKNNIQKIQIFNSQMNKIYKYLLLKKINRNNKYKNK